LFTERTKKQSVTAIGARSRGGKEVENNPAWDWERGRISKRRLGFVIR